MKVSSDKSFVDDTGKIVFVSISDFKEKICMDDVCFLCGKDKSEISMTREHIIPDWILKKFNLHNKFITLPNGSNIQYRKYVLPCCSSCNEILSRELETPISKAFSNGYREFFNFQINNYSILFSWLALIYVKTHLKDKCLPHDRDTRRNSGSISDEYDYDWETMHHIYCIARSCYSGAIVEPECYGSVLTVPVYDNHELDNFDIFDLTFASALGIKIDDIGLIVVFGDGGAVSNTMKNHLINKIDGPLSFPQFREILVHFASCYLHLKNPPSYGTVINKNGNKLTSKIICYEREKAPEFLNTDKTIFGKLMVRALYEATKDNVNITNYKTKLLEGKLSFLFDDNGKFIHNKNKSN